MITTQRCALALAGALAGGCAGAVPNASVPNSYAPNPAARHVASRPGTAGSLDPSFGNGGTMVAPIAAVPVAAAVMRDGRIVIGGNALAGGQAVVVRLLANGSLDKGFGQGGVVTLRMYAAYDVAMLPGGKILIGGIAPDESHAQLVRLNADGTPDAGFGSDGVVQFAFLQGTSNGVFVTIPAPNGATIAGGFAGSLASDEELTSLARFDARGNLDPSFGSGGVVAIKLVGAVTALGAQRNGDILVCGGPFDPSSGLVARFLANGTPDGNDAGGSLERVAHTGSLTFEGANEFDSNGRVLRWTTALKRHNDDVRVLRLLRDGSSDPSFRGRPFAFASGLENQPSDVEVAASGDLLVAGRALESSGATLFGVARLMASGGLDPAFGSGGTVVTPFDGNASADALAIAPDGRIVVAGTVSTGGSGISLAAARYLSQ